MDLQALRTRIKEAGKFFKPAPAFTLNARRRSGKQAARLFKFGFGEMGGRGAANFDLSALRNYGVSRESIRKV